jgi:hypothetical protein
MKIMDNPLTDEEMAQVPQVAFDIWELAFGDNAFENGYSDDEVLAKLKEFSDKALAWDAMYEEHQPEEDENLCDYAEEDYELIEKMDSYLKSVEAEWELK